MGLVETCIRWWRGKMKTFRYDVENKYGTKLTPNHVMWSWLARHSGWTTTRFRVRSDGNTSYFAGHGHNYTGEVVPFGESVLFKAPVSHSRQKRGGKRHHKADSCWAKGIWVGKTENNDEHVVLTSEGKFTCRSVRRMEPAQRHDKDLFAKVCGLQITCGTGPGEAFNHGDAYPHFG